MGLKYKNQVALVKVETVIGTDSVPTAALNAVRIAKFEMRPLQSTDIEIPEIKAALGANVTVPGETWGEFTITINLIASGTAGSPVPYEALLLASAHAAVVTAATKVDYNPVSSAFKTVSLYHYIGGIMHKSFGAVGSAKFTFSGANIPQLELTCQGSTEPITDVAVPVPTLTGWATPMPVNYDNTSATIGGYAACISEFTLDTGVKTERFNWINCKAVEVTDRAASGSITLEMTTAAAKNWYSLAKAGTPQALVLTHQKNGTAGNVIELTAPSMIIKPFTYSEDRGITMIQASLTFPPTAAGNDEYRFTTK